MGKPSLQKETLTDSKSPGLWFPCLGYFPLASLWTRRKERGRPPVLNVNMCPGIQGPERFSYKH